MLNRRLLLASSLASAVAGARLSPAFAAPTDFGGPKDAPDIDLSGVTLRVGLPTPLSEVRFSGSRALENLPFKIEFSRFTASPPALEALTTGAIDLTSGGVGNVLSIAAQPGRAAIVGAYMNFLYASLLVPRGSSLKQVSELKGKRVGVVKGSGSDFQTAQILRDSGLGWTDIVPVYLSPSDGLAALVNGAIDAWSIWDTPAAIAEARHGARTLAKPARPSFNYFYANVAAVADPLKAAAMVRYIARDLKAFTWVRNNIPAWTREQERVLKLEPEIANLAGPRTPADGGAFVPIDENVLADAQAMADFYVEAGISSQRLKVRDVFDPRFNTWLASNDAA